MSKKKRHRTPEAVENHLISLAMDLAEKRLKEGTASSQIVTELIKRGSRKEKLQEEIMAQKKELMKAKVENMESIKKIEELHEEAMKAFRSYSGSD